MTNAGWIFSVLGTLIVLALIVAAVYAVSARGRATPSPTSAGEILDRRLASGELTIQQYEQLRHTIKDGVSAATATADSRSPRPGRATG